MQQLDAYLEILRMLEQSGFWGRIEIEFQDGKVSYLRKNEVIKINPTTSIRREPRGVNHHEQSK